MGVISSKHLAELSENIACAEVYTRGLLLHLAKDSPLLAASAITGLCIHLDAMRRIVEHYHAPKPKDRSKEEA